MGLEKLYLRNFRNYEEESLEFAPGVNLIVGQNAQGKTNLLEAISYLGTGKSFRAQKTAEMIRFSQDFAEISGNVQAQDREQTLRFLLFPGKQRSLFRNGVREKTASALHGILPSVLFTPEDLMILKAGSAGRRKFADSVLCQLRPNYEGVLTEYQKVLENKSRILKDGKDNPILYDLLPEYNTRLISLGATLISYRARFFSALLEAAKPYHDAFSGGREELHLTYTTVKTVTDPFADTKTIQENLQQHLDAHSGAEIASGSCLTGPHKDDFSVFLSGIDLKSYGSQGQTRTAAISLKLAQKELMKRQFGQDPVLLLDDVLSELDPGRQDFVLNQIDSGQVFITCCEPGRFTKLGSTIRIENGKLFSYRHTEGV